MPYEKLCVKTMPGWFVWAYQPVQLKTRKKVVFRKRRVIAGPFSTAKEAQEKFPEATKVGSLYGVELDADQLIKFLSDPGE